MMNPDLPEDILIDIFSRLPAKSVGKMRCLSKSWNTKLSTTQFIKYHLTRSIANKPSLLIRNKISLYLWGANDADFNQDTDIGRGFMDTGVVWFCGSCNGLVLLSWTGNIGVPSDQMLIVLNPITREQKISIPYLSGCRAYGFGYDSSTDDYKIVAPCHISDHFSDYFDANMNLYSMKKGAWREVKMSCNTFCFRTCDRGVFLNGAIHWVCTNTESRVVIAAFDLVNETFYEVRTPFDGINLSKYVDPFTLGVLEGCLCLVRTCCKYHPVNQIGMDDKDLLCSDLICSHSNLNVTSFWVRKECGSWTKFSVDVDPPNLKSLEPIGFIGYEEVVFRALLTKLVSYNLKEKTISDLGEPKFCIGETFVESLVSPMSV